MPVSIHFTRGITDPGAVENAIKVTAKPSVPVEGHWFGNDRLDFRPEKYWAPGTKVTAQARPRRRRGPPRGVRQAGQEVSFTIGRSQVSTVDAKANTMKVVRDGKRIKTIPITAGAPGNETYNGKMVISEKHLVTRMNGATVGFGGEYDIKDVPHAMRLSHLRHLPPRQLLGGPRDLRLPPTSATAAWASSTSAAAATAPPRRRGSSATRSSATWSS